MKCKVEKFEVEKKSFQVKFEGSNGGTWVSVTERSRGFDVSVGFGREEVVWLTEHLKKAVELENTRGFTRKFRGENKIHLMEICFNNRGRFMKITEIATRRNPLLLVIPEGDKGSGWEVLRRAIISVQDYSDQVGEERKKMFGNNQLSKSRYRGGRSYAEVVAEDGIRSGVPLAAGKWARAVICECKEKVQDWTDEGKAIARKSKMVTRAGEAFSERKACSPKKMVAKRKYVYSWKFRRGWLVLKGLPFHLWEVDQLKFILKKWGRVTEVARETVKLLDLTKVKLWVEMHPRVVLPALLEVEDGAWKHTDLEGLMRSLDGVHLSPSVPDARLWPLSSSGLFSVKSFFLALSQFFGPPQVFPSKFVWNSQIPFKVQSFIWLVAHKKVNTNDMLQVRRPYKALSPDICILCMKHGESADHIFLHCSLTIGLWHRLFQLAKMDWVPPRSILDMMYIKFNGFGSSKRGIALWQAANIALIRIVWRERNARIFEDKARNSESLWDSIVFLASLWAYCSKVFKGLPLMRYFLIG
ncbi:hypothetical protein CK203_080499 [Vitis vinifera]|uniref:Reverse transcriptase zinc-binding domain-containing protein n=1 Tax=Vitis vinifera TaxID=29760 RepID=A0A438E7N7_VITVI|nr:hypothetical protein CK203_080499 [Vitis vinifera]